MKTVRDKQAKIVQVATTNARTIIYNLINVYQPYPKLITEHKEAIDQALKELEELLKGAKLKRKEIPPADHSNPVNLLKSSIARAMAMERNATIDDYEKNIKKVIGGK